MTEGTPILRGRIDLPHPGVPLRRERLQLYGWALAGLAPPAAVEIVLNGQTRVPATTGVERPDVPEALGDPGAEVRCGWVADVDLSGERIGPLSVTLEVHAPSGEYAIVAHQEHLLGGEEIVGRVVAPAEGSTLHGNLLVVNGWARRRRAFARVEVSFDGALLGRARICVPPPLGAGAEEGEVIEAVSGFAGWFVLPPGADGGELHEVVITAFDEQGEHTEIATRRVRLRPWRVGAKDDALGTTLRERTTAVLGAQAVPKVSRRRLLVFSHSLDRGGAELYLRDLLDQLQPQFEHCTLVSPRDGDLAEDMRKIGVDLVIWRAEDPATVTEYEGMVRALASFVRASGCGTVIVNTLASSIAADAAVRAGARTIWVIHESVDLTDWVAQHYRRQVRPYVRDRFAAALQRASQLVFVAGKTRDMFGRQESASIVPYGVDRGAIDRYLSGFDRTQARAEHDIDEGALVLLCVGNFAARKDQALLAEAFNQVHAANPDAVLVLVGERVDAYTEAVYAAAAKEDRIVIVPVTDDPWYWFALSDIYVCASDVESKPRTILEAMTFSMPVLTTDVGGIPEMVRDGENGWLTQANDISAMAAGLERALTTSPAELARLGQSGRELVVAENGTEKWGREFVRLIDSVQPSA
jgi:glycosyltransferase involved in cell wall biosynthesis